MYLHEMMKNITDEESCWYCWYEEYVLVGSASRRKIKKFINFVYLL